MNRIHQTDPTTATGKVAQLFTAAEVEHAAAPLRQSIADLEAKLKALRQEP